MELWHFVLVNLPYIYCLPHGERILSSACTVAESFLCQVRKAALLEYCYICPGFSGNMQVGSSLELESAVSYSLRFSLAQRSQKWSYSLFWCSLHKDRACDVLCNVGCPLSNSHNGALNPWLMAGQPGAPTHRATLPTKRHCCPLALKCASFCSSLVCGHLPVL